MPLVKNCHTAQVGLPPVPGFGERVLMPYEVAKIKGEHWRRLMNHDMVAGWVNHNPPVLKIVDGFSEEDEGETTAEGAAHGEGAAPSTGAPPPSIIAPDGKPAETKDAAPSTHPIAVNTIVKNAPTSPKLPPLKGGGQ